MSPEVSIADTVGDGGPGPHPDADLAFLPVADDDGVPVYDGSTPNLLRELTGAGVTARTWHPADACEFASDRGPVADVLIQILVGISSSAGWYALESLLGRRTGQVRVVAVFDDGDVRRRAEITGDAAEVAEAVRQLDPFRSEPS